MQESLFNKVAGLHLRSECLVSSHQTSYMYSQNLDLAAFRYAIETLYIITMEI